jgi:DNA-binding response OmpR family regulator
METAHGVKALLIDDDLRAGAAHKERLEADGYFVTLVTDTESALALIEEAPPAIVFVGIGAKGTGSMDFIQSLRANQLRQHIPVVILSKYLDEGAGRRGLRPVSRENW